jgi:hypothetical protein
MPVSDFLRSPLIEAGVTGLNNRSRVELAENSAVEQTIIKHVDANVRSIESVSGTRFSAGNGGFASSDNHNSSMPTYIEHNSKIDAQLISNLAGAAKSATSPPPVKKGLGLVASPAEVVGTVDALARLDSNGDGRIDQVETQKGVRASADTSTFAALTQYQRPVVVAHKVSEVEDFMPSKVFGGDDVKVDKVFEDKMFDDGRMYQDLYDDQYSSPTQQQENVEESAEVTA